MASCSQQEEVQQSSFGLRQELGRTVRTTDSPSFPVVAQCAGWAIGS